MVEPECQGRLRSQQDQPPGGNALLLQPPQQIELHDVQEREPAGDDGRGPHDRRHPHPPANGGQVQFNEPGGLGRAVPALIDQIFQRNLLC